MSELVIIDDPNGPPADRSAVQKWWRQYNLAMRAMADETKAPAHLAGARHLVMDSSATTSDRHLVQAFCENEPGPYEQDRYTYLTALATCTACLTAHAAWQVVKLADLKER